MRNAGVDEAQAGIKIAGRNINNLSYADDTTLMAESKEELKSLLMKHPDSSSGPKPLVGAATPAQAMTEGGAVCDGALMGGVPGRWL